MKDAVRIAVLVSGGGTNLQALIDAQNDGKLKSGELSLVLSSRADAFALERAKKAGIPCAVVEKANAENQATFETGLRKELTKKQIKVIILAGFLSILSEDFISAYPRRIINVHPSLIPAFCGKGFYGLRVHEAALVRGVKLTGATVHFVNEIPDGGEIILQKSVAVRANDTPKSLQRRVMEQAEWQLLPRAAEMVCAEIIKEERKPK